MLSRILIDRPDLTTMLGEEDGVGSRIAIQDKKVEDQEDRSSEASVSGIVISGASYGGEHTSECSYSPPLGSIFTRTPISLPVSRR